MKEGILVEKLSFFLKTMSEFGLKTTDYKYVGLYADYLKAKEKREKFTFIVMDLANRYGISESSVKRIIRRFERDL